MKKIQITLYTVTLIILATVWAINGYDDTWLYVMAAIIAIPTSWYFFGKSRN